MSVTRSSERPCPWEGGYGSGSFARRSAALPTLDPRQSRTNLTSLICTYGRTMTGAVANPSEPMSTMTAEERFEAALNGTHPVRTAAARPERRDLAQAASAVGCQFQGSSSSRRLAGMSLMRARTSASQA